MTSRECNVTFATQKPGYRATQMELSSAALNWRGTALSARVKARWVAFSGVSPKPLRTLEPGIHIECQPAWRIIVSKIDAVISSTSFQLSPKGILTGSSRLGSTHPLRKKTECGFMLVHFLISLIFGRRRIRSN